MKVYQGLAVSAAIAITALQDWLFRTASTGRLRAYGAIGAVALLALFGHSPGAAAQEAVVCAARLTVEVSPSVPQAADDGFLSSLLNNNFTYRLDLLRQDASSVLEVELTGPGPEYRCKKVIEAMRKDARVQSIHVEST